jgi:hypothetical protein
MEQGMHVEEWNDKNQNPKVLVEEAQEQGLDCIRGGLRLAIKGKNFVAEEGCQLTHSVLVVLQDPTCGNKESFCIL